MIKVLIVEDSPVAQEFLAHALSSDPAIQVVGFVNDGSEALQAVKEKKPDVITMDINMPKMDGFDATRVIMENDPTPIVIVSASTTIKETESTFRALEAGVLAVVLRPPGFGHPEHESAKKELIRTVKIMSEVKVVKRTAKSSGEKSKPVQLASTRKLKSEYKLIAIGASTGGPLVLQKILSSLPLDLNVPVLIVQHIASGFVPGFVAWLANTSSLPIHVAAHGQLALPGHAYVAMDGFHMGITKGLRISLSDHPPENFLRPSVSYLFRTVAENLGSHAVGVLLTGMGKDGAQELKLIRDKCGLTIAQDEASSIVFGMPGEAIKIGAAVHVLSPEGINAMLAALFEKPNTRSP